MAYWLFKSEPESYSFDDLLSEPDRSTGWGGVRNYQARNYLRDEVKTGDGVLFYHSSTDPQAIVGIAKVTKPAHPDPTAFDPGDHHYDPKSNPKNPTWVQVTIQGERAIDPPLTLQYLKSIPALSGLELLRKGSRLSIQPVSEKHWKEILKLAALKSR